MPCDPVRLAAVNRPPLSRSLGVLVFASGAAGLIYQSLWLRSFGLVFGSTTDAVAVVLVVFTPSFPRSPR